MQASEGTDSAGFDEGTGDDGTAMAPASNALGMMDTCIAQSGEPAESRDSAFASSIEFCWHDTVRRSPISVTRFMEKTIAELS